MVSNWCNSEYAYKFYSWMDIDEVGNDEEYVVCDLFPDYRVEIGIYEIVFVIAVITEAVILLNSFYSIQHGIAILSYTGIIFFFEIYIMYQAAFKC